MKTLYLRNVPDIVVEGLGRLAASEGISVSAAAVREPANLTRRADNHALLGSLRDLQVNVESVIGDIASGRDAR